MDIGGNHQENKYIQNSIVNNIQGDNNFIVNIVEHNISSILESVLKGQSEYSSEDLDTFEKRIRDLGSQLKDILKETSEEEMKKIQTPELKYTLRNVTLAYGRTKDELIRNILMQSFIDRLRCKEHSSISSVVDEAIRVLPKISINSLAVLAMKVFERIQLGSSMRYYLSLQQLGHLLKIFRNVSSLDTAHLSQLGCFGDRNLCYTSSKMENEIAKSYELIFIEDIPEKVMAEISCLLPVFPKETLLMNQLFACPGVPSPLSNFYCIFPNIKIWKSELEEQNLGHLCDIVDIIRSKIKSLSPQEIKSRLIKYDSNWQYCFDIMNEYQLRILEPSTVGIYLGSQMLKKTLNLEIPMNLFYPDAK